jgi:hypothetical protein
MDKWINGWGKKMRVWGRKEGERKKEGRKEEEEE